MEPSTTVYTTADSLELIIEIYCQWEVHKTTLIVTGLEGTNDHFRKKLEERVHAFLVRTRVLTRSEYPSIDTAEAASRSMRAALDLFVLTALSEWEGIISAVETVVMVPGSAADIPPLASPKGDASATPALRTALACVELCNTTVNNFIDLEKGNPFTGRPFEKDDYGCYLIPWAMLKQDPETGAYFTPEFGCSESVSYCLV